LLHEFVVQVHGPHRALSHDVAILVYISLLTPHRPSSDQIIQRGGLMAAPVPFAVPPAKLAALRGVDAAEPYSAAPDLQRVAIDHRCGSSDVGESDRRQQ